LIRKVGTNDWIRVLWKKIQVMLPFLEHNRYPGGIAFILTVVGLWRVFEKAGRPGWEALIPFYNIYILLKVVGKPGWWLVFFFIPIANLVMLIWVSNLLAKSFGQNTLFTVGLVLLAPIFLLILGFGDFTYLGPAGDHPRKPEPEELV